MLKAGLVSVTFRKLSPREIIDLVRQARLEVIEWGSDIHVPVGAHDRAREVRELTTAAGLSVAAYGSYYRVGAENPYTFGDVLETAKVLGAGVIRVWAGCQGSASASAEDRERVVRDSRAIADLAAGSGVEVAYEFHGGTLTDTTESALELLQAVAHDNLGSYWQPPTGWSQGERMASLRQVLPYLRNLHVFQWTSDGVKQPLAAGVEGWREIFRLVREQVADRDCCAMLEFVRDESPEAFLEDAAALREILAAV